MKVCALWFLLTWSLFAQTQDETTVITGNNLQLQSFCGGTQIIINGQNIMAYTVVQHTANTGATTLAFGSNLTSGNTALVGVCFAVGQTVSGVSGSHNGSYTQVSSTYSSSDVNAQLAVYRFFNVGAGAETITVSGVPAASLFDIWVVEVSGLGASPAFDVAATNQGTTSPLSFNISPTGADFIFAVAGIGGGATGTLTNLTLLDQVNDNDYFDTTASSGAITCSDAGITTYGVLAVSFNTGGPTTKNGTWKTNPSALLTMNQTVTAKQSITFRPALTLTLAEQAIARVTLTIHPTVTLSEVAQTTHNATIKFGSNLTLALRATGGGVSKGEIVPNPGFWGGGGVH